MALNPGAFYSMEDELLTKEQKEERDVNSLLEYQQKYYFKMRDYADHDTAMAILNQLKDWVEDREEQLEEKKMDVYREFYIAKKELDLIKIENERLNSLLKALEYQYAKHIAERDAANDRLLDTARRALRDDVVLDNEITPEMILGFKAGIRYVTGKEYGTKECREYFERQEYLNKVEKRKGEFGTS